MLSSYSKITRLLEASESIIRLEPARIHLRFRLDFVTFHLDSLLLDASRSRRGFVIRRVERARDDVVTDAQHRRERAIGRTFARSFDLSEQLDQLRRVNRSGQDVLRSDDEIRNGVDAHLSQN